MLDQNDPASTTEPRAGLRPPLVATQARPPRSLGPSRRIEQHGHAAMKRERDRGAVSRGHPGGGSNRQCRHKMTSLSSRRTSNGWGGGAYVMGIVSRSEEE
jgi:hypothetical protein